MRKSLCRILWLTCLWAMPLTVAAQEPEASASASATPVEVRAEVNVDVQQPAPAPAPPPDVNIQVHESAPAAPAVVKSESVKETSVTKISESAPPADPGTNVALILVGGAAVAGLGAAAYALSKRG